MSEPREPADLNPYAAPTARGGQRQAPDGDFQQRPAAPLVFAILDCIWGGLGFLSTLGVGFWMLWAGSRLNENAPGMGPGWWMGVATAGGLVTSGLMLASGIRLFGRQRAARSFAFTVSYVVLGWTAVSMMMQLVVVVLPAFEAAGSGSSREKAQMAGMFGGLIGGMLCPTLYHGLRMYFLSRPNVKQWFSA